MTNCADNIDEQACKEQQVNSLRGIIAQESDEINEAKGPGNERSTGFNHK